MQYPGIGVSRPKSLRLVPIRHTGTGSLWQVTCTRLHGWLTVYRHVILSLPLLARYRRFFGHALLCDCNGTSTAEHDLEQAQPSAHTYVVTEGAPLGWYATALHFEAMAAGAVVLTEAALVPHMASLGFVEGVHYLACNATQGELQATLLHWLHNSDPAVDRRLRAIAERGQRLVQQRFRSTFTSRAMRAAIAGLGSRGDSGSAVFPESMPSLAPLAPHVPSPSVAATGTETLTASPTSRSSQSGVPSLVPFVPHQGWRSATARYTGPDSDVVDGVDAILAASDIILRTGYDLTSLAVCHVLSPCEGRWVGAEASWGANCCSLRHNETRVCAHCPLPMHKAQVLPPSSHVAATMLSSDMGHAHPPVGNLKCCPPPGRVLLLLSIVLCPSPPHLGLRYDALFETSMPMLTGWLLRMRNFRARIVRIQGIHDQGSMREFLTGLGVDLTPNTTRTLCVNVGPLWQPWLDGIP